MKRKFKQLVAVIISMTLIITALPWTSTPVLAEGSCAITDVYTDKACYTTTDVVRIKVEIDNSSGTAATETLTTRIYHLNTLVQTYTTQVPVAANTTVTQEVDWTPLATDFQGYLVKVDLGDGKYQTTGIDISSDFTHYPRYGYSVDFPVGETSAESEELMVELQKDYNINLVQYYDWMYRHELNFPSSGSTWVDLFGNTISEASIQNRINAGHAVNQKAMAYQMAYMVREGYENNGVSKKWGLYKNKDYNTAYNPSDPSTISNIDQLNFPLEGNPGPILLTMNPANEGWQNYMANQYVAAVNRLDFDGIQIDQMGNFWGNIDKYDYWGNYVDLGKTFSSFVNNAKNVLSTNNGNQNYVTMNIVNGARSNDTFSTWDIVNNANTDFQFSELWENSSTYNSLKSYIEWQKSASEGKTMVLAAYMNQYDNLGSRYEAESAARNGLTSGTDSGTTYVTGFDATGDYVSFTITAPEAGAYTLVFNAANGSSTRANKSIYVDGTDVMTVNFDPTRTGMIPASPSWSTYSTEAAFTSPKTLYLTAGTHAIKIQQDQDNTGDIRIDNLTLGTFNKASVRITDSVIAASGAMHIEMGSGLSMANSATASYSDVVMLGHPYYPKAYKMMQEDLQEEMKNHYDFITAYENLLYDSDVLAEDGGTQNLSIQNESVTGSGESGKIFFIPKTKGDEYGILHLINLTGETNTTWRDATSEPTTKTNLAVKYYIPYNKSVSNVFLASPDRNDCMSEGLTFTSGTDSTGSYISFTVPELKYWDMIYYTFGSNEEPILYEAEASIKSGVNVNTEHSGYTGSGYVDSFGELYDSVTFDVEVAVSDYYTLSFTYANATGNECSRLLIVDNEEKGKISFQKLTNWDTWGIAEKGVYLEAGRHRMVVLTTSSYGGYINLDNLKITELTETARSAYMNNWQDTVFLWKETRLNPAQSYLNDGPGIYELRYYESTSADDYNRNEIKNYSMFFRNETDNQVYTTGSNFRATGAFGEDGVFHSTYESYNKVKLSPEITRSYAVVPNQKFMIVKYTVKNTADTTKTINILDMLHVNNTGNQSITANYSVSGQAITIDMSASGQCFLAHGTLESDISGYQAADDTVTDTTSSTCSPWVTFNNDGTLKNNTSVTAADVSTAYTKSITLNAGQSQELYFYLAVGNSAEDIQNTITTARSQTGSYWLNQMSTQYAAWLQEGKSTSFAENKLNDAYDNILIALKQSIVPGSYTLGGATTYKFAAMPAATNPSAYSYKVWARDSAVSAMAMDASGHTEEAQAYWYWLADRQIKTDEGGWKKPGTFWTCYWIWDNSPVSFVEPEYDSIGMFLVGAYRHYEALEGTAKTTFLNNIWDAYKRSADFVMNNIQSNGFGVADCSIWEEQTEYNGFTEALYAAGMDAAQQMAKAKSLQALADSYNGAAGSIRSAIQRSSADSNAGLWNESGRYYNRAVNINGTARTLVDSSSDVLMTYGVVDMMSKRAYDHYQKVTTAIDHDTYGIARYEGDTFYTGKNTWDPGGVEAYEDEPSWPQMSMWIAMMELYSGYDSLKDNALRRLEWFVDRTGLGYAPQGECVSNVTLKACISTMMEPITGASYIMTALAYENSFDMRILPEQYNAGARGTITVDNGCYNTTNQYNTVSDWGEWAYIPYYKDAVGDNTAGDSSRDIAKVYICNDSTNLYIRVDNVGQTLPGYSESGNKFLMGVYSDDFANGSINKLSTSFCGQSMDRSMGYFIARWSDGTNLSKFIVNSSGSWQWSNNITSVIAPQWETNSGRFEMVIPISELASSAVGDNSWANLKIVIGLDTGSGMQEVDFMNLHYRITGSNSAWLFGNSEQ